MRQSSQWIKMQVSYWCFVTDFLFFFVGGNLSNRERSSIAHSLLLSPSYLIQCWKGRKVASHQSIHLITPPWDFTKHRNYLKCWCTFILAIIKGITILKIVISGGKSSVLWSAISFYGDAPPTFTSLNDYFNTVIKSNAHFHLLKRTFWHLPQVLPAT